jgi:hypothetical protein
MVAIVFWLFSMVNWRTNSFEDPTCLQTMAIVAANFVSKANDRDNQKEQN